MRALVKYASGPGNIELRDLPRPGLQPGQVLIQVAYAGVCGTEPFPVNTIHHQAVGTVGGGLRVTAVDRDGNVEAIELDGDDGWFLGIQWHPELMGTAAAGEGLFGALIAAARQHADS